VSLARVLNLPENRTGDKIVGEALLDMRDIKEAGEDRRSSDDYSQSQDSSISDY